MSFAPLLGHLNRAFESLGPGPVKVLSFVSLIYVPVLNYTVEDERMRQLTSRYVPQQSQFECLIQGDSTHETGSFDPWIYLGGPVIKMPDSRNMGTSF